MSWLDSIMIGPWPLSYWIYGGAGLLVLLFIVIQVLMDKGP